MILNVVLLNKLSCMEKHFFLFFLKSAFIFFIYYGELNTLNLKGA